MKRKAATGRPVLTLVPPRQPVTEPAEQQLESEQSELQPSRLAKEILLDEELSLRAAFRIRDFSSVLRKMQTADLDNLRDALVKELVDKTSLDVMRSCFNCGNQCSNSLDPGVFECETFSYSQECLVEAKNLARDLVVRLSARFGIDSATATRAIDTLFDPLLTK